MPESRCEMEICGEAPAKFFHPPILPGSVRTRVKVLYYDKLISGIMRQTMVQYNRIRTGKGPETSAPYPEGWGSRLNLRNAGRGNYGKTYEKIHQTKGTN